MKQTATSSAASATAGVRERELPSGPAERLNERLTVRADRRLHRVAVHEDLVENGALLSVASSRSVATPAGWREVAPVSSGPPSASQPNRERDTVPTSPRVYLST